MLWYVICAIVALVISIALSFTFAGFAQEKGYEGSKYFWLCFFFGVVAYAWVAGLPDVYLHSRISQLEQAIHKANAQPSISHGQRTYSDSTTPSHYIGVLKNGNWICKCGRENSSYVSSCSCGTNKRDI